MGPGGPADPSSDPTMPGHPPGPGPGTGGASSDLRRRGRLLPVGVIGRTAPVGGEMVLVHVADSLGLSGRTDVSLGSAPPSARWPFVVLLGMGSAGGLGCLRVVVLLLWEGQRFSRRHSSRPTARLPRNQSTGMASE